MLISFPFPVTFSAETTKDVDISAVIADARNTISSLMDSTGAILNIQITATSSAILNITSSLALTGTYRLVVAGDAVVSPPSPAPASAAFSPPSLEVFQSYAEARQKVLVDLDLEDESFITPNELIGYFNEGLKEAESEILKIDEDYFLTSAAIPLIAGQSAYDYPSNIYAYKERGIVYSNGTTIYNVSKFRRKNKFTNMADALQYISSADWYQWWHSNDSAGKAKINLIPPARETAVLPPLAGTFTPLNIWYIRRANRVPLLGQYVLNWDILDQSVGVDPLADSITVAATYVTGDQVQLKASGSMPGGLTQGKTYFVIFTTGNSYIKLASTLQNALAGTQIDITAQGTGTLFVSIAANQTIVDNTVLDIPEFIEFVIQWVKCRCFEKEGDPRIQGAAEVLTALRGQMVSTLTEIQQDDDNTVEMDFSSYREMS